MRLWRHLAGRFAAAIALCWAVLVALVLAVVFVEGAGHAAKLEGGVWTAFCLAALGSVQVAWQVLPVACLLGLVVASTQLARSGEWVGLLSLGFSPRRLARPFVVVACLCTGLGWVMAETVLPPLATLHVQLQANTTGKVDAATRAFGRKEHWFRRGNTVLYLPRTPRDTSECLRAPTLYEVVDGRLACVTDAKALRWQGGGWQLEAPVSFAVRQPQPALAFEPMASAPANLAPAAELAAWVAVESLPQALAATHGAPKQQRGKALRALIVRREAAGIPSVGHRLEAAERHAYPTLCLLLVLVALPWALLPGRKRSLVGMLGKAAALVAAALGTSQLGRMLVTANALPVDFGAWLVPALMAAALPWSRARARRQDV